MVEMLWSWLSFDFKDYKMVVKEIVSRLLEEEEVSHFGRVGNDLEWIIHLIKNEERFEGVEDGYEEGGAWRSRTYCWVHGAAGAGLRAGCGFVEGVGRLGYCIVLAGDGGGLLGGGSGDVGGFARVGVRSSVGRVAKGRWVAWVGAVGGELWWRLEVRRGVSGVYVEGGVGRGKLCRVVG
ncbi:hypothetical protein Tco_0709669 [Tanacetum coccineum]